MTTVADHWPTEEEAASILAAEPPTDAEIAAYHEWRFKHVVGPDIAAAVVPVGVSTFKEGLCCTVTLAPLEIANLAVRNAELGRALGPA